MANIKRSCFLWVTAGCLLEQSGLHIFSLETGIRNVSQVGIREKRPAHPLDQCIHLDCSSVLKPNDVVVAKLWAPQTWWLRDKFPQPCLGILLFAHPGKGLGQRSYWAPQSCKLPTRCLKDQLPAPAHSIHSGCHLWMETLSCILRQSWHLLGFSPSSSGVFKAKKTSCIPLIGQLLPKYKISITLEETDFFWRPYSPHTSPSCHSSLQWDIPLALIWGTHNPIEGIDVSMEDTSKTFGQLHFIPDCCFQSAWQTHRWYPFVFLQDTTKETIDTCPSSFKYPFLSTHSSLLNHRFDSQWFP